ncbi:hypothetical protein NADFUDRAFT_83005 [Nadsonia fulvescens var. elongata DSM 6958]|uniref:Protein transport protein SEC31 n=1 Tax=Nadsonia fulvescens var. elongata DSM 6958 TaxID=857566 RepID=A0A1E3PMV2_9ASCO|nr:hypothetical protein NADFUDRAFT_83005 [Nadsonia fulvescens var. elongata DSM 6958]
MVKLKEIPRTATFAWSPNPHDPFMVTGTVAGAIDADFSATTQLEIWDLNLLDRSSSGFQVQPKKAIDTENRFYDIAWGGVSAAKPQGVIAGALEDGTVQLWDPKSILSGSTGVINKAKRHSGAVKSLQFNPLQNHLFASAGTKGEIFVWDLNKIGNPFTPGNPSSRLDEIDAVAWNNSVAHIMATGGNTGFTSVWDLKNKREVLHLHYSGSGSGPGLGRKGVSSVVWHPDNSTKLMTASSDDASPVILIWDLRNANAPEQILTGHDQGILSLDWCKHDSSLLLSSGKDNRTMLWNPHTAENLGEYQIATNWTFQTRFNPRNPEIFASASFDGKITVQTLQDTTTMPDGANAAKAQTSGEDFWNSASYVDTQRPTISLKQVPKWLKRPVGARFGFGGKLISIRTTDSEQKQSKVTIGKFIDDESLSAEATKFTEVIKSSDIKALEDICTERATSEELTPLEKHDWEIINLLAKRDNSQIIKFLSPEDLESAEPLVETEQKDSTIGEESSPNDDEFLSSLSISPVAVSSYAPTGAFNIYGDANDQSQADKDVTRAIILGKLDKAVDILLKENRLADAFLVSIHASAESRKKIEVAYMLEHSSQDFVRVLASVTTDNLDDLVINGDIEHWKDILASLISFKIHDKPTFNKLASQLGDRLAAKIDQSGSDNELRNSALFCYLISSNLEKITAIWINEIAIAERNIVSTTDVGPYSAHMKALHSFVEKVTVYRKVAGEGSILAAASDSLNGLYREYANEIASRGNLELASIFLELLPSSGDDADISLEKARVSSTVKPSVATKITKTNYNSLNINTNRTANASPAKGLYQPASPYGTSAPPFGNQQARASTAVNDVNANLTANSMYNTRTSVYGESPATAAYGSATGPGSLQSNTAAPPPPVNGWPYKATTPIPAYGAPVQSSSTPMVPVSAPINPYQPAASIIPTAAPISQSMPPPPISSNATVQKKEAGGWNDLPTASLGANTSRRQTPAAPVTTASYNYLEAPVAVPYAAQGGYQSAMASPAIQQSLPPPPGPNQGKPVQAASPLPTIQKNPYAPAANAASPMNINLNSGASSPAATGSVTPGSSRYTPEVRATPQSAYRPQQQYGQQLQQQQYGQQQYGNSPAPPAPAVAAAYSSIAQVSNPYAPVASTTPIPRDSSAGGYFPNTGFPVPQGGISGPSPIVAAPPVVTAPPLVPEPTPSPPPAPKHPAGDRSHIPQNQLPIFQILSSRLESLKPLVPAAYTKQVKDAEKRLNILFDHLNNEEVLSGETISDLLELSACIDESNWGEAQGIYLNIITTRDHECSQWGTGIKRLIDMCRAVAAQKQQQQL